MKLKAIFAALVAALVLVICGTALAHGYHNAHGDHGYTVHRHNYDYSQEYSHYETQHLKYHHGQTCNRGDHCPFHRTYKR